MALQKPIMNTIAAFDANDTTVIRFIVNSGDQVVKNRAIIRLGSTNETVYDNIETTFALEHTIAANTLTNGNYYTIQIQTFNEAGGASSISSPITFYCYSTPTFRFINLPTGNIINNATAKFTLEYNQDEGEAINSLVVNAYNASKTIIWTSETIYAGSNGFPPASFNFDISGFEDSSIYYIRAMGQTDQLTVLDTDYVALTTVFDSPSIYTQFSLTNNSCEGYVIITSNVVSLDGTSNPEEPIYIGNEEIDLREPESYVDWENSFAIYDLSTTRIWLRDINSDSVIATFYNSNDPKQSVTLYERETTIDDVDYIYIEGYYVGETGITGYIFSNTLVKPSATQQIMIWLQKRDGMYDISIAEVSS